MLKLGFLGSCRPIPNWKESYTIKHILKKYSFASYKYFWDRKNSLCNYLGETVEQIRVIYKWFINCLPVVFLNIEATLGEIVQSLIFPESYFYRLLFQPYENHTYWFREIWIPAILLCTWQVGDMTVGLGQFALLSDGCCESTDLPL